MKEAYPVIITKENDGYYVSIPDFDMATQVTSIVDSFEKSPLLCLRYFI